MVLTIAAIILFLGLLAVVSRAYFGNQGIEARAEATGFECSQCGQILDSEEALAAHVARH